WKRKGKSNWITERRARTVSCSRHKLRLGNPLRDVRVKDGRESLISESRLKTLLEEKFHAGVEAGQKSLGEQLVQQRGELLQIQNGILRELHNSIPKLIQECEKDLVSLALETAQRVVGAIPISTEIVES